MGLFKACCETCLPCLHNFLSLPNTTVCWCTATTTFLGAQQKRGATTRDYNEDYRSSLGAKWSERRDIFGWVTYRTTYERNEFVNISKGIYLRHVLSTSFFFYVCVYRAAIDEAPLPFFFIPLSFSCYPGFLSSPPFPLGLSSERPLLCPPHLPPFSFRLVFIGVFSFGGLRALRGPTNARHTHTGTWQRQTIVFVSSSSSFFLSGRLERASLLFFFFAVKQLE